MLEASQASRVDREKSLYSREFLLSRPLLQAIDNQEDQIPVLLIDEIDRADEEFESFLLELLSDFQMKVPGIEKRLPHQIVSAIQQLRETELFKAPGIAETLDWGKALLAMDKNVLDEQAINSTLGVVLKYQDNVQRVQELFVDQYIDETP